jgi:hypothetical protein
VKNTLQLWRVFPWDRAAAPGKPFSAEAQPVGQGSGRFDIPHLTPVRYLAESPEHAVGERIQTLRGQRLTQANLEWHRWPLALVGVSVSAEDHIIDLCNPHELVKHDCPPDTLASRDRKRTQGMAAQLYTTGATGFRWWSSVIGDWHATILFANRLAPEVLQWDETPQILTLDHPAVRAAAAMLGMYLPSHGQ